MAELTNTRTSNATKIGQTDDWDAELEQDIADLFGIAINHPITSPIFAVQSITDGAVASAGGGQVNSDGSITGVIRMLTTVATAVGAAGFEFQSTGGERYKICAVSENLELYKWNATTEVWDHIRSLNLGFNSFLEMTDVMPDVDPPEDKTYEGHAGEFVAVNADEDGVEFIPIAPVATVEELQDIGDVPMYPMVSVDQYLKLSPSHVLSWVSSDPGSGAQSFYELDDVQDAFVPSQTIRQAVAEASKDDGDPTWMIRPIPPLRGYSVGSGCHTDPNLTYLNPSDANWSIGNSQYKYMYFGTGTGNTWDDRSDLVFTGPPGASDVCEIHVPSAFPGLWMWQLGCGWLNVMNQNIIFAVVENLTNPAIEFLVFQQDYYMHPPVFNRTVGTPLGLQFYHFEDSYVTTTLRFWTYHPGGSSDGVFRIKIKAGLYGSAPVLFNQNHKYNLLGVRMR